MKTSAWIFLVYTVINLGATAQATTDCDPHSARLNTVRDELNAGNYSLALTDLAPVLKQDSGDFRASYQEGVALVQQADATDHNRNDVTPAFKTAIAFMIAAADKLPQIDPVCAKKGNFYRIFNAIGNSYYRRGDYVSARKYVSRGLRYKEYLSQEDFRASLEYLGLTNELLQNFVDAHIYLSQAALLGSATAKVELPKVDGMAMYGQSNDPAVTTAAMHPDFTGKDRHWLKSMTSDCWVFDPYPPKSEAVAWEGACKGRLAAASGTVTWSENGRTTQTWRGQMTLGVLNGQGTASYSDGSTYDGAWWQSLQQGFGTRKFANGDVYVGFWPGHGRVTRKDGIVCDVTARLRNGVLIYGETTNCRRGDRGS